MRVVATHAACYFVHVQSQGPRVLGRYALYDEIASGGMATVHYGRLLGAVGFSRTVAIKRLHPHYAKDPEFVSMFLDEARLAARIRHPNVVQTLDVVALDGELFLVMEYVQGESLHRISNAAHRDEQRAPLNVTSAIVCGLLHGLHAAHEATNDRGEPLNIVHRDVSPQNVLVGTDGSVRVIDFGVAKAAGRMHTTQDGNIKGKLSYMSPEQLHAQKLDRRSDIFAAGIVLWESLTGQRLFKSETEGATLKRVLDHPIDPPSRVVAGIPKQLDEVALRALQRTPSKRFHTAREMALALESCVPPASPTRVAAWLEDVVGESLSARARTLARIEEQGGSTGSYAPATHQNSEATEVDAPASQSNVSMSSTRRFLVSRSPRQWLSYAVVALVAGLGGLTIARWESWRAPKGAPIEEPGRSSPTLASSSTTTSAAPPASISEVSAPIVSAGTVHSVTATGTVKPGPPRVPAGKPRATTASPGSKKPCVPSYVDDAGIKQYRDCP
jgi:serine/threonine-protein kinase